VELQKPVTVTFQHFWCISLGLLTVWGCRPQLAPVARNAKPVEREENVPAGTQREWVTPLPKITPVPDPDPVVIPQKSPPLEPDVLPGDDSDVIPPQEEPVVTPLPKPTCSTQFALKDWVLLEELSSQRSWKEGDTIFLQTPALKVGSDNKNAMIQVNTIDPFPLISRGELNINWDGIKADKSGTKWWNLMVDKDTCEFQNLELKEENQGKESLIFNFVDKKFQWKWNDNVILSATISFKDIPKALDLK